MSSISAGTTLTTGLVASADTSGQLELQADGVTKLTVSSTGVQLPALSGPAVIEANSSSAALRVTQTGAGNALVVEDSTNPDSSPVVVNADGRLVVGSAVLGGATSTNVNPNVQFIGQGATSSPANNGAAFGIYRFFDDTSGPSKFFFKSRSGSPGSYLTVNSGDTLGNIFWQGDDGTSFPRAASISAAVDGTPGTNDMPGRLVFSTTADGASSPTERMRIDSAGNVGIGVTPGADVSLHIGKNITGGINAQAVRVSGTIQSDVTSLGRGFNTVLGTAAASFTLGNLQHFTANQGTFGAGSTVTDQYGFSANSSLTGATNNYGFYSNIASGTGRWNFYANGTATNYFGGDTIINGKIGIGSAGSPSYGTAGQILTSNGSGSAPSWQSPAGGGSWIYLTSVTGSSVSQIDLEYAFSTTYDVYVVVATNIKGTWAGDGVDTMYLRIKQGGSYVLGSGYAYNGHNSAIVGWSGTTGQSFAQIGQSPRDTTGSSAGFTMYLYSAGRSEYQSGVIYGAQAVRDGFWATWRNDNSSGVLQGLRFYNGNGSIYGTFRLYGIKNS